MRRFSFRSIQVQIFFYITVIVIAVITGAIFLYIFTTAHHMRSTYIDTSNQLAKILSARVDDTVLKADKLQSLILEDDTIREFVFGDFDGESSGDDIYTRQSEFEKNVFRICGYDYPFYHLSILTFDGMQINFGRAYNFHEAPALTQAQRVYVDSVTETRGYKYLSGVEGEKLFAGDSAVAVSRAFSRYPLNDPKAIIEIQISGSAIDSTINAALYSYENAASRVLIYDGGENLIYPDGLDKDELSHYISSNPNTKSKHPATGDDELLSKYTSDYTGWSIVIITPYKAVTAGMRQYTASAVLVGIAAALIALMISFAVAKNISAPIISIKEALLKVELSSLSHVYSGVSSGYDELELLQSAVQEMQEKLESSLDDYVQMRSLSIQSRLLALQSQMNPHFLYNTLSIMAILAEENGDRDVSEMCRKLVAMLRYTSTERESTTLGQEIEHTSQYADLVGVRFGRNVKISYDIDDSLRNIPMPPIILQPLVENCVKYARSTGRPLHVHVQAYRDEEFWYLRVRDNGGGFSDEALKELREKIDKAAGRDELAGQEIEGIGLANIYLRLQLFYGGESKFDIINSEDGASIIIGGPADISSVRTAGEISEGGDSQNEDS